MAANEKKIGQVFSYDGKIFVAKRRGRGCTGCYYRYHDCPLSRDIGSCGGHARSDGTSIIFQYVGEAEKTPKKNEDNGLAVDINDKPIATRPLGEKFDYDGQKLEVLARMHTRESSGCGNCFFSKNCGGCGIAEMKKHNKITGYCGASSRADKQYILFAKVQEGSTKQKNTPTKQTIIPEPILGVATLDTDIPKDYSILPTQNFWE